MIGTRCQLSEEAKTRGLKMSRYRDGALVGRYVADLPNRDGP